MRMKTKRRRHLRGSNPRPCAPLFGEQLFLGPLFEWRPEQVWEGCRLEKQPSQRIYSDPGFSPTQDWATEEAMIWPEGNTSNN